MRDKIEVLSNIVVIVVGLLVGSLVVKNYFLGTPSAIEMLRPGDQLEPIGDSKWGTYGGTLVLALRTGCRYCDESAPFYRTLAGNNPGQGRLVAVFPDKHPDVEVYLESKGLSIESIPQFPLEKLKITGVPTLILADVDGRVVKTWRGVLTPSAQEEVLDLFSKVKKSR